MSAGTVAEKRRQPSRLAALLTLALLALLGCGDSSPPSEAPASPDADPRASPSDGDRREPLGEHEPRMETDAAAPQRIEIPAIGVSAPVIPLGLQPNRALEVPKDYGDAGWWTGGPEPGEGGPAVLAGHVDSKRGPAVFYRLRQLERGDSIRIARADGSEVRFVVTRLEKHRKAEFPTRRVYGPTRGAELRLVTCSGDFDAASGHYQDNTIAFARRG